MAKILLIDDDSSFTSIMQDAFLTQGFEIESARDGEEGLAKATASLPDLIILDILLPTINGLEVLNELKKHTETKPIPIIILTNLDNEKDAETSLSKGALKYILKDQIGPQQIVDTVKRILAEPGKSPSEKT